MFANVLSIISVGLAALDVVSAAALETRQGNYNGPTCGQWYNVVGGGFTLYNNEWNKGSATSGGQCVTLEKASATSISWSSTWTWVGGNQVKSYPNVVYNTGSKQLSSISSMPSSFSWSYSGSNIVGDVAYDIFSGPSSGSKVRETMIWLGIYGSVGPISSSYGADGKPTPIGSANIAGHSWNIYYGNNGNNEVYSFLPSGNIGSFSGDLKLFFKELIANHKFPASDYIATVGAGTEPTTGSGATFKATVSLSY